MDNKALISDLTNGRCSLGIEFGSTRVKAVLIDDTKKPIATGSYDWENNLENGVWTYSIEDIKKALSECYSSLKENVSTKYGVRLTKLKAIGISAMMHGYMAFDKNWKLLTPFRTWRNTITEEESETLTELFQFPIAQRWTISHLLKDILEKKEYLDNVATVCTLSAYVHYLLTGCKVIGVGDASGMFPISFSTHSYEKQFIESFNEKYLEKYTWKLEDVFPEVLLAGMSAGYLTEDGVSLLDKDKELEKGVLFVPPEGDAETGMVATNSVLPRTGNISAGTSAFAMVVLEKPLSKLHKELDLVMTPDGFPVAMAHSNNCTGNYDSWLGLFSELLTLFGKNVSKAEFYDKILKKALTSDPSCGNILSYGYISGEHITGLTEGRPLFVRYPNQDLKLGEFIRSELYSSICAMVTGLRILSDEEEVKIDKLCGHGGFFKTAEVGGAIMAAATKTDVSVFSTAGEGGAWGMALLADYSTYKDKYSLAEYLSNLVFNDEKLSVFSATEDEKAGFDSYYARYHKCLPIERKAVECFDKE